jgi:hypothetical protein
MSRAGFPGPGLQLGLALALAAGACSGASDVRDGSGGAGGPTGSGGQQAARTNPLGQAQIDELVTAHNQVRAGPLNPPANPPLPPVAWDAALADVAYNYLTRCSASGDLVAHNQNRTDDYAALGGRDYVGENIYGSSGTTARPGDAVRAWASEAATYDYAANNIQAAGHYTQLVWRASVRLGCAVVDCPAVRFRNTVLCDYAPGGNIIGERPY